MFVGEVNPLRESFDRSPAMLSAGSPDRRSVIATNDFHVSLAYEVRVARTALSVFGVAAACGDGDIRPTPTASAVVAVSPASFVRRTLICSPEVVVLSLDSGHRDALHDVALECEEDGDHRDHHDHGAGKKEAVLRRVLAHRVEGQRDGQGV